VGIHQWIETVYQFLTRNDEETQRILKNTIILFVHANPDGQELVSSWYMRNADTLKRSYANLPRLYQKYIGHDNNRDFYMMNMSESKNMSRQQYIEWMPQFLYNHHQTGPQNGRHRHRVLRHIGHHDRNAIAFAQAQRLQVSRQAQAFLVGLGKAQILAHEAVSSAIGVFGKTLFEQAHQRAVLAGINVSGHTFGVTLEPNGVQVHVGFSCDQSTALLTSN
jgi:hypothetical protein